MLVTNAGMDHAKPWADIAVAVDPASHRFQLTGEQHADHHVLRVVIGRRNASGSCVPGVQVFTNPARLPQLNVYGNVGQKLSANTDFPLLVGAARVEMPDDFASDCVQTSLITGSTPARPGRVINRSAVISPHHPVCTTPLTTDSGIFGRDRVGFPQPRLKVGAESQLQVSFSPSTAEAYYRNGCSPMFVSHVTIQSPDITIVHQPVLGTVDTWKQLPVTLGITPSGPDLVPALVDFYVTTDVRRSMRAVSERPWKVISAPPDWQDSLAGRVVWTTSSDRLGTTVRPTLDFVDGTWLRITKRWPPSAAGGCTAESPRPGIGCHHYYYDATSGGLQIDSFRVGTATPGLWRLQVGFITRWPSRHLLRHTTPGARIIYHGRGQNRSKCQTGPTPALKRGGCNFPQVDMLLRSDGTYRISERKHFERGHYRLLSSDRVRLDPGAIGGRTRVRAIWQWSGPLDGRSRVLALDLGPLATNRIRQR
jgi:hypothetical protein